MEIRQGILTNQYLQNMLKINSNICKKYNEIFYFYEAKPINQIMFNQKNSLTNSKFKEAMLCKDEYQFLKRYYSLGSQFSKKQIQDRIKMLTQFYSGLNKATYDYHTINFSFIKKIFNERKNKKNKKTAADDTQNQIIKKKNYNANQLQGIQFDLLDDYDIVSISNKSQYIKSDLKGSLPASNESQYFETHYVYQNQNDITMPVISISLNNNDMANSLNHLVCDFGDIDQNTIIKQYQNIQLKRRRRNQGIGLINKKNRTTTQINFPDIFIKPQKSPKYDKSISKQKIYNNYEFIKEQIGPNITGTRDTKQYQNQFKQFNSWKNIMNKNQKTQNNYLFHSNTENLVDKSSQKNKKYKSKQKIQNYSKKYCLNLNTKQIFLKYKNSASNHFRTNTQAIYNIPHQQKIAKKLNDKVQTLAFASKYPIKEQSNHQRKYISNANNSKNSHSYSQSKSKSKSKNIKFSPHFDQMSPKIYTFQKQQNSAKYNNFSNYKFINPFIKQGSNKTNANKGQETQSTNLLLKNKYIFRPQQSQSQQRNLIANKHIEQFNLPIEKYSKQQYDDHQIKQLDILKKKIQRLKQIKINHELSRK